MNKINAVTEKDAVITRLSPLLHSHGYGEPGYEAKFRHEDCLLSTRNTGDFITIIFISPLHYCYWLLGYKH